MFVVLASAVCPLVDEAKRLVQASWWHGLVPAHSWVELGLVPLVGWTMSGGVFISYLFIQEDFKRLSADVWVCFPTLLVVWPEISQHWNYRLLVGARSW